jgi:hypothetical protein
MLKHLLAVGASFASPNRRLERLRRAFGHRYLGFIRFIPVRNICLEHIGSCAPARSYEFDRFAASIRSIIFSPALRSMIRRILKARQLTAACEMASSASLI